MKRVSSVATMLGVVGIIVSACGGATPEVACAKTVAAYCYARGGCHETLAAWTASEVSDVRTRTVPGGTCNGLRYVTEPNFDQSIDFYYDPSGKLVAVGEWGSAGNCYGSCRYTCSAGPAHFDVCAVPVDHRGD
jgi:hypothetical protein